MIITVLSFCMFSAPTAPPDQLSALVSADSLTLMWNSPPFEDTNGVIQYYMARIVEKETGKQFTLTATSTVVVFNNLHPYYKYECSVTAYTIAFGPYSDVIILQLDEEGVCSVVFFEGDVCLSSLLKRY